MLVAIGNGGHGRWWPLVREKQFEVVGGAK